MRTTQGNMLQSLRAVQDFINEHADKLRDVAGVGARKQLDNAIQELSGHVSQQTGSNLEALGATKTQAALRQALLRDHMAPISRIAQANLPNTPALQPLRMPRGRPTTQRLASLAAGMGRAAGPFAPTFVAAGLPEDFVARLAAATEEMLKSVRDRERSRGRRGGATSALKKKLSDGRKIVKILDAFVKSAAKDDPALLADWNIVKRVQRVASGTVSTLAVEPVPTPTTPIVTPPASHTATEGTE